jgi:hypothetical protein
VNFRLRKSFFFSDSGGSVVISEVSTHQVASFVKTYGNLIFFVRLVLNHAIQSSQEYAVLFDHSLLVENAAATAEGRPASYIAFLIAEMFPCSPQLGVHSFPKNLIFLFSWFRTM